MPDPPLSSYGIGIVLLLFETIILYKDTLLHMLLLQRRLRKSQQYLAKVTTKLKHWLQQYKDASSKANPYAWMTPEPVKSVKEEESEPSDPPPDKSVAASAG